MSTIIIDQEQSKKFKLDTSFWIDLYHLENDPSGNEYLYNTACQLQELQKKGFINPWDSIPKT